MEVAAATQWPAVLGGGAAAGVVKATLFLIFLSSFYSTPSSDLISYLKITNKYATPPRSKEQKM